MTQNINLFDPAFRKPELVVSLMVLVACLAVALLALGAHQYYFQAQVNGLAEELRSAEAVLKAQRGYSDKLKGADATRKRDEQLNADIARLEPELKQARESLEALKGGAMGTQGGFAEYLRAFSRQSLNGLWLTGLTIGGGEIEIQGRTLSADLVPNYIQRLSKEKVLAGRSFARLEMTQPPAEPETAKKGDDNDKEAQKAARRPRFLEFSLATAEASKAEKIR
jgi:Tfp pilus assembly protein PilN